MNLRYFLGLQLLYIFILVILSFQCCWVAVTTNVEVYDDNNTRWFCNATSATNAGSVLWCLTGSTSGRRWHSLDVGRLPLRQNSSRSTAFPPLRLSWRFQWSWFRRDVLQVGTQRQFSGRGNGTSAERRFQTGNRFSGWLRIFKQNGVIQCVPGSSAASHRWAAGLCLTSDAQVGLHAKHRAGASFGCCRVALNNQQPVFIQWSTDWRLRHLVTRLGLVSTETTGGRSSRWNFTIISQSTGKLWQRNAVFSRRRGCTPTI